MMHLWRRWYVKVAAATVIVLALLAVVWFAALKPTYTADEVTKKMQDYMKGKFYAYSLKSVRGQPEIQASASCYDIFWGPFSRALVTLHYIPYRRAWRIEAVVSYDNININYTWLFDDRTGTIASSDPQC